MLMAATEDVLHGGDSYRVRSSIYGTYQRGRHQGRHTDYDVLSVGFTRTESPIE